MIEVEQPGGRDRAVRRPDAAASWRAGLADAGVPLLGTPVESIHLAEDRAELRRAARRAGPEGPALRHGRARPRRRSRRPSGVGYPLLVRPSLRARRPRDGDLLLAARRSPTTCAAPTATAGGARSSSTASSRTRSRSTWTRSATATSVRIGGDHAARRGGRRALGRLGLRDPGDVARPRDARARSRRPPRRSRCGSGVVGLINIQFAVYGDDELYVIEANPRASRTVPFVSKAIGVPLAKVACRLMLGERLADMDLRRCPRAPQPRVGQGGGAAVRPLPARRRPARARDEVDRRGDGRRRRLPGRVRQGAGRGGRRAARRRHRVHLRHRRRQAGAPPSSPPRCHDLGFTILATGGTAQAIRRMGVPVERILKLSEGSPNVVERDRGRRGGPRDQHAHRLGRARRRLGDPPRGGRRAASRASPR